MSEAAGQHQNFEIRKGRYENRMMKALFERAGIPNILEYIERVWQLSVVNRTHRFPAGDGLDNIYKRGVYFYVRQG